MLAMDRISDPQPSPDGSRIVFVRRTTDLEANRGRTDLWLVASDGEGLRRLTTHPAGDHSPRWAPDGRHLVFSSSRDGERAVYIMNEDAVLAHETMEARLRLLRRDAGRVAKGTSLGGRAAEAVEVELGPPGATRGLHA